MLKILHILGHLNNHFLTVGLEELFFYRLFKHCIHRYSQILSIHLVIIGLLLFIRVEVPVKEVLCRAQKVITPY